MLSEKARAPVASPKRTNLARARRSSPSAASRNPLWATLATRVQAKLTVNQPGDEYEQEADRMADHVMRMAEPVTAHSAAPSQVQRMCPECEEELQRKPESSQTAGGPLGEADGGILVVPPVVESAVYSRGEPLDASTRGFMESRFGHPLGAVRLHTDAQAAAAAHAVNARAFTLGTDVVFGPGQYAPGTGEGRRLLAHELAHVLQQTAAPRSSTRDHGSATERAASRAQIQRAGPAIPAGVAVVLAAAGRFLLACIIGAAFGVALDYALQQGWAWWQGQPFHWNTCYAIVSGIIGCVSAGVGAAIARALFRTTGGHLETDFALKAVVWFLTWLYGKFPVVPIAIILNQLVKLGCVSSSELPAELQNPEEAPATAPEGAE